MRRIRQGLACAWMLACAPSLAGCETGTVGLNPGFLTASANRLDFGEREIGTDEERTIYLLNNGQVPLTLQPPMGDTLGGVFAVIADGYTIRPSKDVVLRVHFTPADPTTYTATIAIANDSTNQPSFKLILHGKGVEPDPCQNVHCAQPPNPTCISESTTRHYEPLGTCQEGQCRYTTHDDECQFGCDSATGQCKGDPCLGMACDHPPSNCYLAIGTCEHGACRYMPNNAGVCDDGQACTTSDHCSEGTCVGTPTACAAPPAPICVDSSTRRVWSPQGACNTTNGGCEYQSQDQHCEFGCRPEGCEGDPCAGITCNTPPSSQCYEATGTCSNGQCHYNTVGGACDDGDPCTTNDGCNAGACAGSPMVCNTPPAADCPTATDRRVYTTPGTCSGGVCQYASATAACDDHNACTTGDRCENGGCTSAGSLGCDDGNPCTVDRCDAVAGCVHTPSSGGACTTGSSECPTGFCSAGTCLATPNVTCVTSIQRDLCQDVDVAGVCSASGQCIVSQVPPQFTCPGCNGICLQCYFFQLCIPL